MVYVDRVQGQPQPLRLIPDEQIRFNHNSGDVDRATDRGSPHAAVCSECSLYSTPSVTISMLIYFVQPCFFTAFLIQRDVSCRIQYQCRVPTGSRNEHRIRPTRRSLERPTSNPSSSTPTLIGRSVKSSTRPTSYNMLDAIWIVSSSTLVDRKTGTHSIASSFSNVRNGSVA